MHHKLFRLFFVLTLVFGLMLVTAPQSVHAAVESESTSGPIPAVQGFTLVGLGNTPFNQTIGYRFTVLDQAVRVISLGFYDQDGDGLTTTHQVGIWTEGGQLLDSINVPAETAATLITPDGTPGGGYRYVNLASPLLLDANTNYVVGAIGSLTDFAVNGVSDLVMNPIVAYVDSRLSTYDAGFTFPNLISSNDPHFAQLWVNLLLEPVIVTPPTNDNFVNAEPIGFLPFSTITDVTLATNEASEPQLCYYSMERTVWYSFIPTENIGVRVNTLGSTINRNVNIYQKTGPGISDLTFLNCAVENDSFSFLAEAGQTYYMQVGSVFDEVGNIQINLEQIPTPANDNFFNATVIPTPLPFDDTADISVAGAQIGEPTSSCASFGVNGTIWYIFTPSESGSISAKLSAPFFSYTVLAAYSGNSLANLTELGCSSPYGAVLTLNVHAGTTYYFQAGNFISHQGNSIQFHLETTPAPQSSFYNNPGDPSKFDTIQFQDNSNDPGNVGIQTYTWNFGDGSTASGSSPTHKYAADGDYQVTHSVTTIDGRTGSVTQTVQVRTHDVAITKIAVPASANVGQTKTITVTLRNKAYPEQVQIDLYKSTPNGFVWVASVTKSVPALSGSRTTSVNFSYQFTSDDAKLGKVTFQAIATLMAARDAYPSDNQAISSITKVAR